TDDDYYSSQDTLLESARHRPGRPPARRQQQNIQSIVQQSTQERSRLPSLANLAASQPAPGLGSLASRGLGSGSSLRALTTPASTGIGSGLSKLSLGSLSSTRPTTTGIGGSADGKTGSLSIVGKALAALKTRPAGSIPATASARSGVAVGALQNRSLSQMSHFSGVQKDQQPASRPVLKNFGGGLRGSVAGAGAGAATLAKRSVVAGVQSAKPSLLASFILDGECSQTSEQTSQSISVTNAVADSLKREIEEMMSESTDGCLRQAALGPISGDISFVRLLVTGKSGGKAFAFDTPSPDDRVFAAQSRAVGASISS
ncbi:hypothetical protein IW150_006820, partial [Coemansia sp. RSA 2607]